MKIDKLRKIRTHVKSRHLEAAANLLHCLNRPVSTRLQNVWRRATDSNQY